MDTEARLWVSRKDKTEKVYLDDRRKRVVRLMKMTMNAIEVFFAIAKLTTHNLRSSHFCCLVYWDER